MKKVIGIIVLLFIANSFANEDSQGLGVGVERDFQYLLDLKEKENAKNILIKQLKKDGEVVDAQRVFKGKQDACNKVDAVGCNPSMTGANNVQYIVDEPVDDTIVSDEEKKAKALKAKKDAKIAFDKKEKFEIRSKVRALKIISIINDEVIFSNTQHPMIAGDELFDGVIIDRVEGQAVYIISRHGVEKLTVDYTSINENNSK